MRKDYPFNGNTRGKHEDPHEDVWVSRSGKTFRLRDMSTDHLVNAVSALLRDQLRDELGLDRSRYDYLPNAFSQNRTVARVLYVAMGKELQARKERG